MSTNSLFATLQKTAEARPLMSTMWGVLALSLLACGPPVEAEVCVGGGSWCSLSNSGMPRLNAVYGFGDNDVWAVGDKGYISHFDGSGWQRSDSGVTSQINALWGKNSNELWAVGSSPPLILHYQQKRWTPMPLPVLLDLYAICGLSENDVWAVGDDHRPLHWDGTAWKAWPQVAMVDGDPRAKRLTSLMCASPQDVWAAGYGPWHSYSSSSKAWDTLIVSPWATEYALWGASAAGGAKGWAVSDGFELMRYSAGRWGSDSSLRADLPPLLAVHGQDDRDVWAVGRNGTLARYDGSKWALQPAHSSNANLRGVWVSPTGSVFAIGQTPQDFGIVLHHKPS